MRLVGDWDPITREWFENSLRQFTPRNANVIWTTTVTTTTTSRKTTSKPKKRDPPAKPEKPPLDFWESLGDDD